MKEKACLLIKLWWTLSHVCDDAQNYSFLFVQYADSFQTDFIRNLIFLDYVLCIFILYIKFYYHIHNKSILSNKYVSDAAEDIVAL